MGSNKVFIATSLDGFIADKNGSVDFLYKYPEPEGEDMGYYQFMSSIDALLMGRKTFETVLGFGVAWPYTKPVFVWSSTLVAIPEDLNGKAFLIKGTPTELITQVNAMGHHHLYIDGGRTIRAFLEEDLIDEMIITTIPVLLGDGIPLFGHKGDMILFRCEESKCFSHGVTQSRYIRQKN